MWTVAGIAGNAAVADTMADLIMSRERGKEARALSRSTLFHRIAGRDRERILELLDNRTTADIARGDALRKDAHAWLEAAHAPLSRSGSAAAAAASRSRAAKPSA
jgi:hypothetical protein